MAKKIKEVTQIENATEMVKKEKAPKKVITGVTPKVLAEKIGTDPAKIRGFLRANFPGLNGGKGRGYDLTDEQVAEIIDLWNNKPVKTPSDTPKKAKKSKKAKTPEVEVAEATEINEVDIDDLGDLD